MTAPGMTAPARLPALELAWRDLRYAARQLLKHPAFAATAIVTLALCIGANTAIFTVVHAVLLRPLPYPDPDRLAELITSYRTRTAQGFEDAHDGEEWRIVRERVSALDFAAYSGISSGVNLVSRETVTYVRQQRVSADFFRVLGVQPIAGRTFAADEDRAGGPAVTILGYELWTSACARDPGIIGRSVMLRGEPHAVLGIMPAGFRTSVAADVWTPLRPILAESSGQNYGLVGRLRSGFEWAQADAEIAALSDEALRHYRVPASNTAAWLALIPFQRGLTESVRTPLLVLWGAVGLVLLIGCINVGGLLLARGAARRREIATRLALGASSTGVVRQLFVESVLLAALGGLGGIAIGIASIRVLTAVSVDDLPRWATVSIDTRVIGAMLFVTALTSIACGLFPAWQATRVDVRAALVEGGGYGVAGGARRRTRRSLIAGQIALTAIVLIGACLMIRSFFYLHTQPSGFDPAHVFTATVSMQDARYSTRDRVNGLFEASLDRIRALPGVESAAVATTLPFQRALNIGFRQIDWPADPSRGNMTTLSYVTPGYFEALRIQIRKGRSIMEQDRAGGLNVAVVNEAFVHRHFSQQEPLGHHIRVANGVREIVGVVANAPQAAGSWGAGPLAPLPEVFIPAAQTTDAFLQMVHTWFSPRWIVRAAGDERDLVTGMERAIATTDPNVVFAGFQRIDDLRASALAPQRAQAVLLSIFAALALGLAGIGTYGVMASAVLERKRELGIRLALGATMPQAVRAAAMPGMVLSVIGVASGCLTAWLLTGIVRRLVWGISATDGLSFALAAVTLLLVSGLATLIPASKVLRLDPAGTLRGE
jgi:predicted permease